MTLSATAAGSTPLSFAWTQAPTDVPQVIISNANTANASFTTPVVAANTTLHFTATATNSAGSASAPTTVNVAVDIPTVNHVAPQTLFSGAAGSMAVTGSDPNIIPALPLFFTATQAGAPALTGFTVTQGPNPPGTGATITFTAPVLPLGQVTTSVVNLTITATNSGNVVSAPEFTSVTITPLPDRITVTSAIYRVNNKRLILTLNSSVISPNVNLLLQSYVTTTGSVYNPDPAAGGAGNLFTNTGGGVYTLTINGVPEPACGNPGGNTTPCPTRPLDVRSNLNGDSGGFALTKIQ